MRGSSPIFYSQVHKLSFGPKDESFRRSNLHFSELEKSYQSIFYLCLTGNHGKEGILTDHYREAAENSNQTFYNMDFCVFMYKSNSLEKELEKFYPYISFSTIENGQIIQKQSNYNYNMFIINR